MKSISVLTALAVLAGSTSLAQAQTPDLDQRMDNAFQKLRQQISDRGLDPTAPGVTAAVNELKAAFDAAYGDLGTTEPTASTVKRRLKANIDVILANAAQGAANIQHLNALQIDAYDLRVRNAIRRAKAAYNANPTADNLAHLHYVKRTMSMAADAAKADLPTVGELRTRTDNIIDAMIAQARVQIRDLDPVEPDVSTFFVQGYVQILDNHFGSKTLIEPDWTRARDAIIAHAVLVDPTAQSRLVGILDGLKAKVADGSLKRTDFLDLKKQLVANARAATAPTK